jgi:hypothetical protein
MAGLFADYEINRNPIWPRLSKLVLASLVFHVLTGFTFKYIPLARGIFGIVGGASDVTFVDEDYERTKIQDEAIMLTLQGGKFQYPDGFFSAGENIAPPPAPLILPVAAPPPVVPLPQTPPPSVAQLPTPMPMPSPPPATDGKTGKPAPKGTGDTLPPAAKAEIAKQNPTPTPKPKASPTPAPPKTAEEAEELIAKTTTEKNISRPRREEINRRPINDAFKRINDIQAQRGLNFAGDAEAAFTAERTPENRLANIRVVDKKGDESLIAMISELITAFGDSGAIKFLPEAKGYRVDFSFKGPEAKVVINVEMESPDIAKEQAGAYGLLLMGARVKQKGKPEEVFLKNGKVSSSGKNIVFTCVVPRQVTNDLIAQNMADNAQGAATTAPTQTP